MMRSLKLMVALTVLCGLVVAMAKPGAVSAAPVPKVQTEGYWCKIGQIGGLEGWMKPGPNVGSWVFNAKDDDNVTYAVYWKPWYNALSGNPVLDYVTLDTSANGGTQFKYDDVTQTTYNFTTNWYSGGYYYLDIVGEGPGGSGITISYKNTAQQ